METFSGDSLACILLESVAFHPYQCFRGLRQGCIFGMRREGHINVKCETQNSVVVWVDLKEEERETHTERRGKKERRKKKELLQWFCLMATPGFLMVV